MTCIICGTETNPHDLCHTCQRFFLWRYRNDGVVLELVLDWFRMSMEVNKDEVDSIYPAAPDTPATLFDGSAGTAG